jgi:aspartate/methionine/tyrosine aminotransferase
MRFNALTVSGIDSPIGNAYAMLEGRARERDLLDLAQAAPTYPPAPAVAERIAEIARDPHGAGYAAGDGLPRLREAFAADVSAAYRAEVSPADVQVTAGCNQAFCLTISALAGPGDEVVQLLPYYFNHDMWLRMNGIRTTYLDHGPDLMPDVAAAEALIGPRTRAIVVVSPGNPTGAVVPPETIAELAAIAARHDIALVLDETYRSFRGTDEAAHALFADPRWRDTLVSLHSFSKDLAIPGYRVGAILGSEPLRREVKKLLDCVAICAPRVGQEAVATGLTEALAWRDERARDLVARRGIFEETMAKRPGGFELLASGGFFGWVRHPFEGRGTDDVVRELALTYDTLVITGTAFLPDDRGTFRVSCGNASSGEIAEFASRLEAMRV